MKTVRSFLAVNLDIQTASNIAQAQKELIEKAKKENLSIGWVPPQNFHVTIRYLGNLTLPMVRALKDQFTGLVDKTPPFKLIFKGINLLYAEEKPTILYTEVFCENNHLEDFYKEVCGVLENSGFRINGLPFLGHVTLARIKKGNKEDLQGLIENIEQKEFESSLIKDLVCYRSDLKEKGADYKLLWKLALQGKE